MAQALGIPLTFLLFIFVGLIGKNVDHCNETVSTLLIEAMSTADYCRQGNEDVFDFMKAENSLVTEEFMADFSVETCEASVVEFDESLSFGPITSFEENGAETCIIPSEAKELCENLLALKTCLK